MRYRGPIIPKRAGTERWLYEELRRLGDEITQAHSGITAIGRGEQPDGSGLPLPTLDDYLYKPGRTGGQLAHGGKNSGESLTLSSTKSTDKGSIYLGSAQQTIYDETDERIGINEPNPDAKLHITTGSTSTQAFRPTSSGSSGICWGPVGAATLHEAVDDTGSDAPTGTDYIRFTGGLGGGTVTLTCSHTGITDPIVNTGFVFHVTLAASAHPHQYITFDILSGATPIITLRPLAWGAPTFGDTVFPLGSLQGDVTTGFVRYTYALSDAECALIDFSQDIVINVGTNVTDSGTFDCAQVELVIPPVGGVVGDPLQKWEYTAGYNLLQYASDANAATTLELSGTPKFRIVSSGLEFDIGTPVSGYIWSATDTEGTGAWTNPATLHTRELFDWVANGPYIVDTTVDAARIVPTAMTITTIKFWRGTAGSGGTTTIVLKVNGTTQATLSINASDGSNFSVSSTVSIALVANDKLSIDTTAIETGEPQHYSVVIEGA